MNPGLVDINHERDATDDDMPLITICPTNQTNTKRIQESGYYDYDNMLMGFAKCKRTTNCTSWGAHENLLMSLKGKYLIWTELDI